jgi:glucose-1-phosphate thymidylyltransferase
MKGIILAGGSGSRLYPITNVVCKQLQPIYDKPMIYYPLSLLMLGGIKEILIISTPKDTPSFQSLLGDGSQWGIKLCYKVQEKPDGIPNAFVLGEEFIGNDDVTLILGDNLFYGDMNFFRQSLEKFISRKSSEAGHIFAYYVRDPWRFGVIELDEDQKIISIEEKPKKPRSNMAIPGLYFFDSSVVDKTKNLSASERGEKEIADLINHYFSENKLEATQITRGVAWLDTGTPKSFLDASSYVATIEERQGLKIGCPEEIAYRMKFIDKEKLTNVISSLPTSPYRQYLEEVFLENNHG